jgi:hypothetical protein
MLLDQKLTSNPSRAVIGGWNVAVAISDAFVVGEAIRGVRAGAFILEGASNYSGVVRDWYRESRGATKGVEQIHHWLVPQGSALFKQAPGIVNQPWNLMSW